MNRSMGPVKQLIRAALRDVTPIRLWLLFGSVALGFLLFCVISVITVQQHLHALKTVGSDAAPSVIAAHQIKIGLAAMDGALADELMSIPGQRPALALAGDFEHNRLDVCHELVVAAKNITYGHKEQGPIESIQAGLGAFLMQAQAARDFHQSGKEADALLAYRAAWSTLKDKILPSADDLNKANSDVLEETYGRERSASALSRGLVLVLGMVLVCLLFYVHIYVSVHFHRRLNLPIIFTMIILAIFLRYLTTALSESSAGLTRAKEYAYDSVQALLDARSSAYLADAALSRCLLDHENMPANQRACQENLDRIAAFPDDRMGPVLLVAAAKELQLGRKPNLQGLSGALAKELANVRFEGEREGAIDSFETFLVYKDRCGQERKLMTEGNDVDARSLGLGYDPHGTNMAFSRFDDALVRTMRINNTELEQSVRKARHALQWLVPGSIILSILLVIATYLGLRPRIQEYQADSFLHRKNLRK
ncbi:MAG: hypothetical protein JST01_10730 [Cyanobacteria bacterium SZAS TMP-1]|nr:hypothetical protein [Cyanobacteria bacterium SZAS TMP-1]